MRERPILFSGPMVLAIMEGRKTQTRRIIKPQPYIEHHDGYDAWRWDHGPKGGYSSWKASLHPLTFMKMACARRPCPYGVVGDRLWVRESFSAWFGGYHWYDAKGFRSRSNCTNLFYRATHHMPDDDQRWIPSIHMPRWASRLTLEVTDVRVQRLQDITEEEAIAEGCCGDHEWASGAASCDSKGNLVINQFVELWDSINEKRGHPWSSNSWVRAVEFRRVEGGGA